jgi:Protein of unknown function (DUF3307)
MIATRWLWHWPLKHMTTNTALLYLTLLLIKHSIADLMMQGRIPGGDTAKLPLFSYKNWVHSWDHALLGLAVTIPFAGLELAALLCLAEFACHYAIDHAKSRIRFAMGWSTANREFWHLQGVDQIAHTLWYLFMAYTVTNC